MELLHLYEVVLLIEIVHQVQIDHQEVLQELEGSEDQNVVFLHYKVDTYRQVTKNYNCLIKVLFEFVAKEVLEVSVT